MAKIDRAKEYIGFIKAIFISLIVIDASLIAWLFENTYIDFRSSLVIFAIALVSLSIIVLLKHILKKIKDLEEIG